MKTLVTDHLIVGAGLAGSTLGYVLRQAGADTLNLEMRDADEKDKLCAGFMSGRTVRFIAAIYGQDAPARVGIAEPLPWLWRCLGQESSLGGSCHTVRRKALDDYCLSRLREAGGVVRDRTRLVSVDEDARLATCRDLRTGNTFLVRYGELVGADGALSSVRRLLTGRQGRMVISLQGTVPALPKEEIVTSIEPGIAGYCWYAPSGPDATVGCFYRTLGFDQGRERLARFCAEKDIEMPALRGAPIPTGDDVLLRAGAHAWLVGDAAGLTDPSTGGGIHHALRSACLLATSFLGEAPYEEVMLPTAFQIEANAKGVAMAFRRTWLKATLQRTAPTT